MLHRLCCASSLSSDVSFVVDVMDKGVPVYQLCAKLSQPASTPWACFIPCLESPTQQPPPNPPPPLYPPLPASVAVIRGSVCCLPKGLFHVIKNQLFKEDWNGSFGHAHKKAFFQATGPCRKAETSVAGGNWSHVQVCVGKCVWVCDHIIIHVYEQEVLGNLAALEVIDSLMLHTGRCDVDSWPLRHDGA